MGSMYMSKLSRAPFEYNLNGNLIVLSDYEVDRPAKFPNGEKVIHVIEPERGYLHELTGN